MADEEEVPIFQEGNRLKINTVLDRQASEKALKGDPLLAVALTGTEGFSIPFSYTVTLWRLAGKPLVNPADLINTAATISVKLDKLFEKGADQLIGDAPIIFDPDHPTFEDIAYVRRCGVIETFQYDGFAKLNDQSSKVSLIDGDYDQYTATIIPAFKMLSYETAYRVFEGKDVIEIIKEVVKSFPNLEVNYDILTASGVKFPKMEYCVQFGETSHNFLSRLMAEFGIWYFFEHDKLPDVSQMSLGFGHPEFKACHVTDGVRFPVDKMRVTTGAANAGTICDWKQAYSPISRWARRGNFNPLIPTSPFSGGFRVVARNDMIAPAQSRTKGAGAPADDNTRFRTEGFGAYHFDTNADAVQTAQRFIQGKEPLVETIRGQTKNAAFIPGYKFDVVETPPPSSEAQRDILKREDALAAGSSDLIVFTNRGLPKLQDDEVIDSYIITRTEIRAIETAYHHEKKDFLKIFADLLWPDGTTVFDALATFTNQGLNNYLQNGLPLEIAKSLGTPRGGDTPWFFPFFLGGGAAVLTSVVPILVKALATTLQGDQSVNTFSCAFFCTPVAGDEHSFLRSMPLPSDWTEPRTSGPHLAVVIGEDGTDTSRETLFADPLGRVRVRFPWDRGPAKDKESDPDISPFLRGANTCWVRVSEGWAGRNFGHQFLPRIGQEVIVDFLAGDPDRPIITGRVYNADKDSHSNRPFVPDALAKQPLNAVADLRKTNSTEWYFSGVKTRSIPLKDTDKPRFHLLRFNDNVGKEQYLIRSQRRLDITALEKRYESISSDRHLTVGGVDQKTHTIGGNYITKIFKDYNLHVGDPAFPFQSGNRNTKLEAAESLAVGQNSDETIGGDWAVSVGGGPTVGGQVSISALAGTGVISLSAMTNITLMCGTSLLVMTPVGVSITAGAINLVGPVLAPSPMMAPAPVPLPPMPAIPAMPQSPQDPTPADPGDDLTPPKEG